MNHITLFENYDALDGLKIGDLVKMTSLEGTPEGSIYDITGDKIMSYWIDVPGLGKMEFSDFELEKIS
jgi:hypothetical protein